MKSVSRGQIVLIVILASGYFSVNFLGQLACTHHETPTTQNQKTPPETAR
jgi:hypothetical protein